MLVVPGGLYVLIQNHGQRLVELEPIFLKMNHNLDTYFNSGDLKREVKNCMKAFLLLCAYVKDNVVSLM